MNWRHRGVWTPSTPNGKPAAILAFPATWRYRALVPVTIPALGYGVVSLGYVEGASTPALETKVAARESDGELSIENEMFCIKAKIGESIQIEKQGVACLKLITA